jgi:iron complex outermembrane receptor protein
MRRLFYVLVLLLLPAFASAQEMRVVGRVTDESGAPLQGAQVAEKGTLNYVLTDANGRYVLRGVAPGAMLSFQMMGYGESEAVVPLTGELDAVLPTGVAFATLYVVGTRRLDRSAVSTPVPVDVIPLDEVTSSTGRLDVNQLLQFVVPSFNANRQSGADGSDHVDPATLRGLGPDQTLVLINGTRRHQSSLINIFGSRGRGNTGTDLNAIPVGAIERIEVLRDGASAQYGSDAIAGVINIVLKTSVDELTGYAAGGIHNAEPSEGDVLVEDSWDGEEVQLGANYGVALGELGYVNFTAEYLNKGRTNRPADPAELSIYRRQFGDAEAHNFGFFVNALYPLSGSTALYAFGGSNFRDTDAFAWTRDADSDRNVPEIYPDGFDPRILSNITDRSLSAGMRTDLGRWNLDINNTFGVNRFHYLVDGSLNASLLTASPTRFDAGGFQLAQNTTGLHLSRLVPSVLSGVNVAFGVEHRTEDYEIFAGEEASWRNYGIVDSVTAEGYVVQVDTLGRPGGSQGFPGFQPANEKDETRTNLGAYADVEVDLTPAVMIGAAARWEDYSDFGNTLTGRVAGRVSVLDWLAVRASAGTGFRAPSLAQLYFNSTFTDFVGGVAVDKIIAENNSPLTRALGIPALQEETSTSFGAGITMRLPMGFTATIDGYIVNVDDRIVLTGAFEDTDPDIGAQLVALNVGAAQFFTNALDTETKGLDVVLAHSFEFMNQELRWSVAANFNDMELGAIHTSDALAGKEDIYFGPREQRFLLASAPPRKISGSLMHGFGPFETELRLVNFGEVKLIDWIDEEDVYEARTTTDLSVTYRMTDNAALTFGGANIFNVYPSAQDTETETGGLWDSVQMGSSGAFYFARMRVRM